MKVNFLEEVAQYCKVNGLDQHMVIASIMFEEDRQSRLNSINILKCWLSGKYMTSSNNITWDEPLYKVYRKTKYSSGCPSGWVISWGKIFSDKEEALKYMRRQNQLLQVHEGLYGEVTHYGALYTHPCGTQVMLILESEDE